MPENPATVCMSLSPRPERFTSILLVEPRGVVNTGAEESDRTRANDVWI